MRIDNWQDQEIAGQYFVDAVEAASTTGSNYLLGNAAIDLYLSSGISVDYAAGAAGIPYAYTIELPGGGTQGFDIPPSRIRGVVEETQPGLVELGRYIKRVYG